MDSVTLAGGVPCQGNVGIVGTVGGGCIKVVGGAGFWLDEGSFGTGAADSLAEGGWDGIVGFVGIVAGGTT